MIEQAISRGQAAREQRLKAGATGSSMALMRSLSVRQCDSARDSQSAEP
jgi:hypothetical protein